MKNTKMNENGGDILIPLNKEINVIIGKKFNDDTFYGWVYEKVIIKTKGNKFIVNKITEKYIIISAQDIIDSTDVFYVCGEDINNPKLYQQLMYSGENGFTTNKTHFHY